jgi:hypothetical protein
MERGFQQVIDSQTTCHIDCRIIHCSEGISKAYSSKLLFVARHNTIQLVHISHDIPIMWIRCVSGLVSCVRTQLLSPSRTCSLSEKLPRNGKGSYNFKQSTVVIQNNCADSYVSEYIHVVATKCFDVDRFLHQIWQDI